MTDTSMHMDHTAATAPGTPPLPVDEATRPVHAEALARLEYLLQRPFGGGVVLGPPRSGKTSLLRTMEAFAARWGAFAVLVDGCGRTSEGLAWDLAAGWRLAVPPQASTHRLWEEVRDFALGSLDTGQRLVILLDHADRLPPCGMTALARLLHEAEARQGMSLIWSADSPLAGEAAEWLLPLTELRIDCPAPTRSETAVMARTIWQFTGGALDPQVVNELADAVAELAQGDMRRAERLCRLSLLAAGSEQTPPTHAVVRDVAAELA